MKQRPLGHTGLNVSELCLGTMGFGWRTRAGTALSLLDEFYDSGGNFLEAAGICSALIAQPDWIGLPEACIGEWLQTRGIAREELTIATRMVWSPGAGLPGGNLADCCDASLRRLRTDYLDILVCDWTPDTTQLEDVFAALRQLVTDGKVRHVGVSGFAAWHQHSSGEPGLAATVPLDLVQENYSLLQRECETDLLALDAARRPAFLARSPLAGGFLAAPSNRWLLHDRQRRNHLHLRYGNARAEALRSAAEAVAQERGVTLAQVALSWVLSNPAVSSAIMAPLSIGQLKDAFRATAVELSRSELRRLDLISSSHTEVRLTRTRSRVRSVRPSPAVVVPFES